MRNLSTLRVDPRLGVGISAQIRNAIALLIADGGIQPGERLPAVRVLAGQLGVNVNTVRAAYARLAVDGLAETRHGVGTVVLAPHPSRLPVGARALGPARSPC